MTKKILTQCLRQSLRNLPKHSQFLFHPHTTYIIQANELIEWGENRTGDPPLYFGYGKRSTAPKLHAELVAYRKARGLLDSEDFELVNVLLNKQGETKTALPCVICQAWLREVGCRVVWFTVPQGWGKVLL